MGPIGRFIHHRGSQRHGERTRRCSCRAEPGLGNRLEGPVGIGGDGHRGGGLCVAHRRYDRGDRRLRLHHLLTARQLGGAGRGVLEEHRVNPRRSPCWNHRAQREPAVGELGAGGEVDRTGVGSGLESEARDRRRHRGHGECNRRVDAAVGHRRAGDQELRAARHRQRPRPGLASSDLRGAAARAHRVLQLVGPRSEGGDIGGRRNARSAGHHRRRGHHRRP